MEAAVDESPREPAVCCSITTDRDVVAVIGDVGYVGRDGSCWGREPTQPSSGGSSITDRGGVVTVVNDDGLLRAAETENPRDPAVPLPLPGNTV